MLTLLSVIIGPIITGIIGNALVQRWQLRSWYIQQRQINRKEELDQLQRVFDEISSAANDRIFSLRSFIRGISSEDLSIEGRKSSYQRDVAAWNTQLNTFYARLTMYINYNCTLRLERSIHNLFVAASIEVEGLYEKRKRGGGLSVKKISEIDRKINLIQGEVTDFIRDILREILDRRSEIMEGKKVYYNESGIYELSTGNLIKFLFSPNIDGLYVVRSA